MSRGRSTHPPTLIRLAERTIREEELVPRGSRVLVAVSGGPDSMALMDVLARLKHKLEFSLYAQAVTHGIRPEAEQEVERAAMFARELDVPFGVTHLNVTAGGNLQERARHARLAALREAAKRQKATRIALGHHADDRAETVLMRILRGTGPAGLAVMPPRADDLIRPLIQARRFDVICHLDRHGIAFAQDPSNQNRRFVRARVRQDVLPVLESISPQIVKHLCALSEDLGALELPRAPIGRAQLRALAQAAAHRDGGVRVSLPAGRVAKVDVSTGRIVVEAPNGGKGAQKPRHAPDDA